MTPEAEDLVRPRRLAADPEERSSYWEFLAIPIQGYRIVLLCAVVWCGVQTTRTYLAQPTYTSVAVFRPLESADVSRTFTRLASLVGLRTRGSDSGLDLDTEAYLHLVTSREVLDDVVAKTYELSDGRRVTLPDLLEVRMNDDNQERRIRATRRRVRESIDSDRMPEAGMIRLSVTTRWPEVSYAIAQGILETLDSFRATFSRARAQQEKEFIGQELKRIEQEVAAWEDSLRAHQVANRVLSDHSEEFYERNRIRGQLEQRHSLQTDLMTAYMEASINMVRNERSLFVTAHPRLPRLSSRDDLHPRIMLAPLLVGLVAGTIAAVAWEWVRRSWDYNNPVVVAVREAWPKLTAVSFLRVWFWPQADHGPKGDSLS